MFSTVDKWKGVSRHGFPSVAALRLYRAGQVIALALEIMTTAYARPPKRTLGMRLPQNAFSRQSMICDLCADPEPDNRFDDNGPAQIASRNDLADLIQTVDCLPLPVA
jgi:hypothetical protein